MKNKFLILGLIPFICTYLSGCAAGIIVAGAAGALGGYAISKDTIQGDTDKPYDRLWESAAAVSQARGIIKQEDSQRGYIYLEVESSKVYINLVRLTRSATRVKVSARKHHLPNLNLAQDLFIKIMDASAQ